MSINNNEKHINDKTGDGYRQFGGFVVPFILGMMVGIFVAIVAAHS